MGAKLDLLAGFPRIESLADWADKDAYVPLPQNWKILVCDFENSKAAIDNGSYKAVNAIGAACIIAVCNAVESDHIPFVFGGDGAVIALPEKLAAIAIPALIDVRTRALATTGLCLRVGCVSIEEIRSAGVDVNLAVMEMAAGFRLSLFSGGGLSAADQLVKSDYPKYRVHGESVRSASLDGLECRWNDVPSANGRIMALLVKVKGHELSKLQPLISLLGQMFPMAAPVKSSNLPISWPPRHLNTELKLKYSKDLVRRLMYWMLWTLTGAFFQIVKRLANDPGSSTALYMGAVSINTDHLKLDDTFRAVLDVSDAQAQQIENLLQAERTAGQLEFGIHYSQHALMTCFVRNLQHHFHFIDGGDGGYAQAAATLKQAAVASLKCNASNSARTPY